MPDDQEMLRRARELRKQMTPQERKLWYDYLRIYPEIKHPSQSGLMIFFTGLFAYKHPAHQRLTAPPQAYPFSLYIYFPGLPQTVAELIP